MKFSRWQVFEHEHEDLVLCKSCGEMLDFEKDGDGRAPEKLPKRCPKCRAVMLGRTCWFAPKE